MSGTFDLFQLTRELAEIPGPSGFESAVTARLSAFVRPYADEVYRTPLGALVARRGSGRRVMLSAHADTPGIVATCIEKEGFIRFGLVGGIPLGALPGARVRFANGVRGVIGREEKVEERDLKISHFYVDVGARDGDAAAAMLRPGEPGVLDGDTFESAGRIVSNALSNRLGCAVLLCALAEADACPCELYAVFSTQNEVGARGALTAAYAIEPALGVAVDVTDSGDVPERKLRSGLALGRGPALKVVNGGAASHPAVTEYLARLSPAGGVQYDVRTDGQTDITGIQLSRGGVAAGGISIPVRYRQTASQLAQLSDARAAADLLCAAIRDGFSVEL